MTTTAPNVSVDVDEDADDLDLTFAPAGAFSPAGRECAIREALPVLGRYFQKVGGVDRLRNHQTLGAGSGPPSTTDQRLMGGLRLRSALASAAPILDAIREIGRQPSFRYSLTSSESVGHLGGTLDVPAYTTRLFFDGGPTVYPISEVRRSVLTPENRMTAYAALWMVQELEDGLTASDAPAESPEARRAEELRHQFLSALALPTLAPCQQSAVETLHRGSSEQLFAEVEVRLRRGEIGHGHRYQRLYDVLRRLLDQGPTGEAGDATWSFYDNAFDTRLFEIWCLLATAKTLSDALSEDLPDLEDAWAGSGLAFRWERPAGVLEMFSQKSLPLIDTRFVARWVREGSHKAMRGIPDIVVRGEHRVTGEVRCAFLDAKLRQRSSPPTEELYKLLGYFDNFGLAHDPQGAILFHDPRSTQTNVTTFTPVDGGLGRLIATPLNPSNAGQTQAALVEVTDMLLSLLLLPPASRPEADPATEDGGASRQSEGAEEAHVSRILDELRALKVQLLPGDLLASRRRMETAVGQFTWSCLTEDAQDMLATADQVGFNMADDADYSGPVLGVVCPLEILLDSELIEPAKGRTSNADSKKVGVMLGQQVRSVLDALDGDSGVHHQAIRDEVSARNLDTAELRRAMTLLGRLNRDQRRRAAHKEKLPASDWYDVYQTVVARESLLPLMVAALQVQPRPST